MPASININTVAAMDGVRLVLTCVGLDLTKAEIAGDCTYETRARAALGSTVFFERVRGDIGQMAYVGQSKDDRRAVIVMHREAHEVTRKSKRLLASLVANLNRVRGAA